MGTIQFQKQQEVIVFDNGDNPILAKFNTVVNGELQYLYLFLYLHGTPTGNVRVNILSAEDQSTPIESSDYINLSALVSATTNRITWVRFDFNRLPVNTNTDFYIQVETSGYTRNGDTDYLGVCLNQVDTTNSLDSSIDIGNFNLPAEFKTYIRD